MLRSPMEPVQTKRQQIIGLLQKQVMSAREISRAVGVREKEVYEHLSHVAKSVSYLKKQLRVIPSRCLRCGYVFKSRKRLNPPSRCPECKDTHIQDPSYQIV